MRPGPLRRGKPLERRTPMKRGGALRRRRRTAAAIAIELRRAWIQGMSRRCAACGIIEGEVRREGEIDIVVRVEGHHVVRVQLIRRYVLTAGMDAREKAVLLWDVRNRLPLCERCHARHHARLPALSWSLIEEKASAAIEFAKQVNLLARAKQDYEP